MGIQTIIELIEALRGEHGCPWDRKQTPRTLAAYLAEETHELIDAIEAGNPDNVCEELGDVLFHILFIALLFQEAGHFNIRDVAAANTAKMTRRHPHVFGNVRINTAEEVRRQWQQIKLEEKQHRPDDSILDSIRTSLPALMRAYRVSERAAKTGFDWENMEGVLRKVEEEWAELKSALGTTEGDDQEQKRVALEFGDVLFTLVNVARFAGFHPETALAGATKKFGKRFRYLDKTAAADRKAIASIPADEKERLWALAKQAIG